MPKVSAGLLVYRLRGSDVEVFLVHPGGPFWQRKDAGAWTIPKGEIAGDEDPLATARREFTEETGFTLDGPFADLGVVRQAGGKRMQAFVVAGDFDAAAIVSNRFKIEWPPKSGRSAEFPEVDRAAWFSLEAAKEKINPAQVELLDRLQAAAGKINSAHGR